jgi:hypothetical protein
LESTGTASIFERIDPYPPDGCITDHIVATYIQDLARTARALLSAGGNLQSIGGREQIEPAKLRTALTDHLKSLPQPTSVEVNAAATEILTAANGALSKVADGNASQVTALEYAGLEVIVLLTGRPAMRYLVGRVQLPDSSLAENERWQVFVVTARNKIDAASASVARLNRLEPDSSLTHLGTGWRLGDDLLVTNRHVASYMVENATPDPSKWKLDGKHRWIADFAKTDQAPPHDNFEIGSLEYCADDDAVDAAVLRLKPAAEKAPPALDPDFGAITVGGEIYVVGHPMQTSPTAQTLAVFGDADGFKRCSPGQTTAISDEYPVLNHDCSTLRGNSGSAVLDIGTHRVIGLHFGGRATDAAGTFGDMNAAVAFSKLGKHRFAEILANGHL